MLLGFKTKLKPNNKQRNLFAKHCGIARHAWNIALSAVKEVLEHNKNHPDNKLKFPSSIDLHKWLVASIKPDCPWPGRGIKVFTSTSFEKPINRFIGFLQREKDKR